jgi:hypothetical protein
VRGVSDKAAEAPPQATGDLLTRMNFLEGEIEQIRFESFYGRARQASHDPAALTLAVDRYARDTSDGWLTVLTNGTRTSIPSGLKVAVSSTANGRDYGTIKEGILDGTSFDVTAGNLQSTYRRVSDLKVRVKPHAGSPAVIDGISYDLDLSISYKESGSIRRTGPYPATTDPSNPLSYGIHDLEIADFPHPAGARYGAFGTVWFRIGHSGDRYLHPGRISLGCMTCAPRNWPEIYQIVNAARADSRSVGTLEFTQAVVLSRTIMAPHSGGRKEANIRRKKANIKRA